MVGTDPFLTAGASNSFRCSPAADEFAATIAPAAARLAFRHAVPTVFQFREFAVAGGLSYGGSITEGYRLVGIYVGRILKGAKPTDLLVQQVTKVELLINLKAAK